MFHKLKVVFVELVELVGLLPTSKRDLGAVPIAGLDLRCLLHLVGVEESNKRGNNTHLMAEGFRGGV